MSSQKIRNEEGSEPNYENLSRVFRSNLFPSVQRCWRSSAKDAFIDHGLQTNDINKQNFRQTDWLGKWHERDVYRLNVLRMSDDKYQERMKRVRHSVDLPSINKQAKTNARVIARKSQQPEKLQSGASNSKNIKRKGINHRVLPAIKNNNNPTNEVESTDRDSSEQLKLPNIAVVDSNETVAEDDGTTTTEQSHTDVETIENESMEKPSTNISTNLDENIDNINENNESIVEIEKE